MPLPPPKPSVYSDDECAICNEPLPVASTNDPLHPSYVIDSAQLRCKHRFHRSCIVEYATASPDARKRCAICRANVLNTNGDFIVNVTTENGFVGGMDLGRDIDELAYLSANPEVDRAQTFLSLMAQMEFAEAEKFLKGEDGMGAGGRLDPDVTYETGRTTAMHMAALNDDVEGVRLLLAYGADREFRDEEGKTALDMARGQDAKAVIALLS